jgi:glycine/D-amino acid oxidase-like deaminating enzyme
VVVIGGGLFGLTSALSLATRGYRVSVLERARDVMRGASYANQNRIHLGYHYPRSRQTALETIGGCRAFREFFADGVVGDIRKFYAIAHEGSLTDASAFEEFCSEMGLPLRRALPPSEFLNPDFVKECWAVPEEIFDYRAVRRILLSRVSAQERISVLRGTEPSAIVPGPPYLVRLGGGEVIECQAIVNASYTGIADVLRLIDVAVPLLQFELCVMPVGIVDATRDHRVGVTVLDGSYGSLIPRGLTPRQYILYLVDESVAEARVATTEPEWRAPVSASVAAVLSQAPRCFPIVRKMRWIRPIVGTRVVLPETEHDDARPTLIWRNAEMFFSIFSGKVTMCIDAAERVARAIDRDPEVALEASNPAALAAASNGHSASHLLATHEP